MHSRPPGAKGIGDAVKRWHSIRCGRCSQAHRSVKSVRLCYTGIAIWPCWWEIDTRRYDEDGAPIIETCGADAQETDRGWGCTAGHEHVSAEIRAAEGWDYADDEDEARLLRSHGVDAVAMNGSSI